MISKIKLTFPEVRLAHFIGQQRYLSNRKANIVDKKIGAQDNYWVDLIGAASELAFCKFANVWPDLSISPRKGGIDCILNQIKIDVKGTEYDTGRLLGSRWKDQTENDIFVLITGRLPLDKPESDENFISPILTFQGWAWTTELFKEENKANLGRGETYALEQSQLHQEWPLKK